MLYLADLMLENQLYLIDWLKKGCNSSDIPGVTRDNKSLPAKLEI